MKSLSSLPIVNRRRFLAGCAGGAASLLAAQTAPDRSASTGGGLKVQPAFVPLPPGAVSPKGWLRDWAVDASQGITGHLDEYNTTFHEAWRGYPFTARGAHPDGTGWPLEQCSYWLDGAVRLAYMLNDTALIEKVKERLDMVVAGVLNGGESFIYWRPKDALTDTFNNWAHSQMGRALVAYYQASGDPKVLEALVKTYRSYPLPQFRSRFDDVNGSVNVDAMLDAYRMSGDGAVLDNVAAYAQTAAYRTVAGQWLQGQVEPGHNVIFYENIRVPALLYTVTGNKDDLAATQKALAWNDEHNLLPMGLSSGEEWHSGVGATRGVETCNVAASMWSYLWLLRITGQSTYSDRIEKVFFNAGPGPVARDFKTMSYYQSPNWYSHLQEGGARGHNQFTNIGSPVLCCVGNLNRVIPNYVMHMWMTTADRGLAATLYGPAEVHTTVGDNVKVAVEEQTAYPFEEAITLAVKPEKEVAFPLYLRIPGWCRTPKIEVNGKNVPLGQAADSFIKVDRKWRANDKVVLRFPMSVKVLKGRETPYPQIPYFQRGRAIAKLTDINSPYASVYYGPLLFALPIPDVDPNQEAPNADYGYALDVTSEKVGGGEIAVVRHPMPGKWAWPLSAPVQLAVKARKFDWKPTDLQPMPKDVVTGGSQAKVLLTPYGCTKFRICMFPVTQESWGKG